MLLKASAKKRVDTLTQQRARLLTQVDSHRKIAELLEVQGHKRKARKE
jgi:hypothetical protein